MEGAKAQEVLTRLLQLYVAPHHIDDVDARKQILDETLRNHGSPKVYAKGSVVMHQISGSDNWTNDRL